VTPYRRFERNFGINFLSEDNGGVILSKKIRYISGRLNGDVTEDGSVNGGRCGDVKTSVTGLRQYTSARSNGPFFPVLSIQIIRLLK
jgi:hypothetical protein